MLRFKQQYIISHLKFEFELFNSPGVEEIFDNGQIFYKTFQLSPLALYFPKKTTQFLFIYQACKSRDWCDNSFPEKQEFSTGGKHSKNCKCCARFK